MDDAGRLFLARRGLWEFPGGAVEFGERLVDALRREIHEEYGIEIAIGELLDVADHILPAEGQHWVSPSYLCRTPAQTAGAVQVQCRQWDAQHPYP